jgi:hypothetical protein
MSANYDSHAIIGLRIDRSRLFKIKMVGNCSHDIPGSASFCPQCGKPAGLSPTTVPIEGFDFEESEGMSLDGWRVLIGPEEPQYAYVCLTCTENHNKQVPEGFVSLDGDWPWTTIFDRFKQDMESRGLWDAVQFGLHSVIFVYA